MYMYVSYLFYNFSFVCNSVCISVCLLYSVHSAAARGYTKKKRSLALAARFTSLSLSLLMSAFVLFASLFRVQWTFLDVMGGAKTLTDGFYEHDSVKGDFESKHYVMDLKAETEGYRFNVNVTGVLNV